MAREVAERKRTEHVLREAQDGLVQAGKMAVLGQMAAGITHELNQPLAALRTLSDNARLLLAKARTDDVQNNLTLISELTDRMAKITGQLKAFARKSPLQLGPVSVRRALANVQALLEQRLRTERVAIVEDWSEDDVKVQADANRLEQVLVNLVVNALDAMQVSSVRHLEVSVARERGAGNHRGTRHRARHRPRPAASNFRAVRHDQGAGRGAWSRAGDFGEHHPRIRRFARGREPAARRDGVHDRARVGNGDSRCLTESRSC